MKSKLIALTAIAAAFDAIVLTVGAYFEFADLFALVISSIFVVLPLYYRSYTASVLCYLVGGVIALIFSGFNFAYSIVFPAYFAFFGLYPIIRDLMYRKKFNVKLGHAIRLVWLVASFYGAYFYYTLVMKMPLDNLPEIVNNLILYLIGVIAIVFYFIFDRFVYLSRVCVEKYVGRIVK